MDWILLRSLVLLEHLAVLIRHPIAKILILPDSKLEVPWNDARLLVVPGSITSQLQDLGSQVLHDCCHVDWRTSSDSLGIVALPTHRRNPINSNIRVETRPEQPVDPAHRELKSCPAGAGLGLMTWWNWCWSD